LACHSARDKFSSETMASQFTAAHSSDLPEISREELLRRLKDSSLTIVDVLPQASYVEAHIPRAINIPLEQIQTRARELLPDFAAEIAVYCGKFT
jgi:rhodanese-related sulfurtransferase